MKQMRAAILVALSIAVLVASGSVQSPAQFPELPIADDFPPQDSTALALVRRGMAAKRAAAMLDRAPASSEMVKLLIESERLDEALEVLASIVREQPEQIGQTFLDLDDHLYKFIADDTRDYARRYPDVVESALVGLKSLPREKAAMGALRLAPALARLSRPQGPSWEEWHDRVRVEYAGTEAAELARVELILRDRRDFGRMLAAFDAVVREQPGTVIAAKALYMKGFELTFNAHPGSYEPRGTDPTERFLQVFDIVEQLESGAYPSCAWLDDAPGLPGHLWAPDDTPFSRHNLERLIDAFLDFAVRHVDTTPALSPQGAVGSVVNSRLPQLYERRGDGTEAIERTFHLLEERSARPDAVRYLRVLYYLDQIDEAAPDNRHKLVTRSREVLERLVAGPQSTYSRRALATLAASYFYEKEHALALDTYSRYLADHPDSDWAWVAGLRIGQIHAAEGRNEAAVAQYRSVAAGHRTLAVAAVLGHVYGARALESLGHFEEALAERRQALAAWDHDYGKSYWLGTVQRRGSPTALGIIGREVSQVGLVEAIERAEWALRKVGGTQLEHGRWLLQQKRRLEARRVLETLVATHPNSEIVPAARYLAHRARLEEIFETADVQAPEPDEATAVAQLEALATGTWDPAVAAANIARAAILWRRTEPDRATALMDRALAQWRRQQGSWPGMLQTTTGYEADIVAIRNVLFLPLGGGVYGDGSWNGFEWPEQLPQYLLMSPIVEVQLPNHDRVRVSIHDPLPGLDNVLFATAEHRQMLYGVLSKLGGTDTQKPRWIMETPNQPIGGSMAILDLWKRYFPARPGHWFGWVLRTYPHVRIVEFLDEEHTRANAYVTIGYAGATVVMEKSDGTWKAVRVTNRWVT